MEQTMTEFAFGMETTMGLMQTNFIHPQNLELMLQIAKYAGCS